MFFKLVTLLPLLATIASIHAQVINVGTCEPVKDPILINNEESTPLKTRTDGVEGQNLLFKDFTTRSAHFTDHVVSLDVTSVLPPIYAKTASYSFVTIDATNAWKGTGTRPGFEGKVLFAVEYYNVGKKNALDKDKFRFLVKGGSKCKVALDNFVELVPSKGAVRQMNATMFRI